MYQRRGLGFAPVMSVAAAGGPIGIGIGAAVSLGLAILSQIQFHAGSNEADAIVPVANSLVNPDGTGRVDEIVIQRDRSTNVVELQSLLDEMQWIKQTYDNFLNDPKFVDGRASDQARATMFPVLDQVIQELETKILSLGGRLPPPQITQGYGSAVPRLVVTSGNYPYIPQAGMLPPIAPLSPIRPNNIQTLSAGLDNNMLMLGVAGGLAWFLFARKGR